MRIAVLSAAVVLASAALAHAQPAATPAPASAAAPVAAPAAAPAVAAVAAPATTPAAVKRATTAPADSTLGLIIAKGMTMNLADMEFIFTFKPADGTFETSAFAGKYWIEDAKLCFDIPDVGYNACSVYPAGKKSGDKFPVDTDNGPADIKIS